METKETVMKVWVVTVIDVETTSPQDRVVSVQVYSSEEKALEQTVNDYEDVVPTGAHGDSVKSWHMFWENAAIFYPELEFMVTHATVDDE